MVAFLLSSPFKDTSVPTVLMALAIMLLVGFLLTRLTKPLKLPNVTAYIFAGILLGPLAELILGGQPLFPSELRKGMEFITDLALAFIAFGVVRYFKFDILKKSGSKIIIITLFESLMAVAVSFGAMMLMNLIPGVSIDWELAILLAAIASATAPASTMMTIRQTGAKGDFVNTILQVVSLDNAIALILFSVAMAIITGKESGGINFMQLATPIFINIVLIVAGYLMGLLLYWVTPPKRTKDNRLIIAVAFMLGFSGVASLLDISPLLGVMAMGMAYTNIAPDESLFRQIDAFSPPILTLFFVLSGMRLQLHMLASIGVVGVVYFIVRIIGKYVGATLGSAVARSSENNKKYLGLALIPQAGVSLGLAALGSRILVSYGHPEYADMLTTIIVAAGVLYEIFGPPAAKYSLAITKSYTTEKTVEMIGPKPSEIPVSASPITVPVEESITEVKLDEK
ncbi:MAG: Sodium/hydrogen exchanger family protein [Tenericutes bacterium ADurb.Bin087]|nr:MAG: Sodium/hydrogen exchanger family protein [Tenericutes bacterium ADurb.Bin087]